MHEVLVQHYLYGKTKNDGLFPIENVLDFFYYRNKIPDEKYKHSWKLAEKTSEYIKENILDFPIESIHRKIKKTQEESHSNATDLLINNRVGLSLKVSMASKKIKPTLANVGVEVLQELTGIDPSAVYELQKEKFFKRYPDLVKLSSWKKVREEYWNNEDLLKDQRVFSRDMLLVLSSQYFIVLKNIDKKLLSEFIRKHVLRAWKTSYPVYQIHTNFWEIAHKIPYFDYDHILNDYKNISLSLSGTYITFKHYDEPFAALGVKVGNMFGSSIKFNGSER